MFLSGASELFPTAEAGSETQACRVASPAQPLTAMVISACHAQALPPSGAAFAVGLSLTPPSPTLGDYGQPTSSSSAVASSSHHPLRPSFASHRGQLVSHLVTARDGVLDVFEVRRKQPLPPNSSVGNHTIAEMNAGNEDALYHVRSHSIFGVVTGLARCKVNDNTTANVGDADDNGGASDSSTAERDTLVVSFADAKMALMQWSDAAADLVTISIHTYERASQLTEGLPARFVPALRADPESRCVALLLPHDAMAILPFYNDTAQELDQLLEQAGGMQDGLSLERSLPYAPSFLLQLQSADPSIKNVRDFVFLPNFQRPTIAVLFEKDATWTGRLDERSDTCGVRFVTLDLTISLDAQHRVISSKDGLPFDCLYLTACPQSLGGGVMIVTTAALIHIDQNGRSVGLAVSGWHALSSKLPLPVFKEDSSDKGLANGHSNGFSNGVVSAEESKQLDLTGSHVVFPDSELPTPLLVLGNGSTWLIDCSLEGRSLASMTLIQKEATVVPSLATKIPRADLLFVGSMTGPSQLLRVTFLHSNAADASTRSGETESNADMDLDADLYGESALSTSSPSLNGTKGSRRTGDLHLETAFELSGLGPILHVSPAVVADGDSAGGLTQTMICSGGSSHNGLNLLEPQIVPRQKVQLALSANDGLFLLHADPRDGRRVLLASSLNATEIATIDRDGIVLSSQPLRGRTIFARDIQAVSEDLVIILRVTAREVQLISQDRQVTQNLALGDDRPGDIDIFTAEYSAGYLSLLWTDGSMDLLRCDSEHIQPVDLPEEVQGRKYVAVSVFVDLYKSLQWHKSLNCGSTGASATNSVAGANSYTKSSEASQMATSNSRTRREDEDEEIDYGDDDFVDTQNGEAQKQPQPQPQQQQQQSSSAEGKADDSRPAEGLWLVLTSSEACIQIYSLSDMRCAWQSNSLYPAPSSLNYVSQIAEEADIPSMQLAQVQLSYVGDVLHLTTAFENGLLNVYEAVPCLGDDADVMDAIEHAPAEVLSLSFSKVLARELDVGGTNSMLNASNNNSVSGLSLVPFEGLQGHRGLFIGGASPAWLLRSKYGVTHLYMSAESPMVSFGANSRCGDNTTFAYVQFGMACLARMPELDYTHPIAHQKKARTGRTYTKAVPHPFTKTLVAASALEHQFVLFDPEDGHVIEEPSLDPTPALSFRSALELFVDGESEPVDGYEFEQCEVVTCLELVTLRSRTSVSGLKDFVAAGTIISHGEDRPARGATYIFDVIEVVAAPNDPASRFKLRMLVKDEAKAPITALSDMNGYLVVVMGLKVGVTRRCCEVTFCRGAFQLSTNSHRKCFYILQLFVRSLEKDEWLITIAFLDTPFQTTSLQRLKNFLLLTDVKRSVWFVAFQEEPYRLVVVSKDYNLMHAVTSGFLVKDEEMVIAVTSKEGVLRLFDYAPSIPASQGGQRLLVRSEYDQAAEASSVLVVPGPPSHDGGISTSSELVFGMMNGAIEVLQPVDDEIFNTLHLLQGHLVRNVQHFAGLNPRGFRAVRNELSTRPLAKGVLDARLLASFEMLPRPKMVEIANLIPDLVDGSDQLLRYLATLRSSWGIQQ